MYEYFKQVARTRHQYGNVADNKSVPLAPEDYASPSSAYELGLSSKQGSNADGTQQAGLREPADNVARDVEEEGCSSH